MRFGKFETAGKKPIGTGADKETFSNPADEARVISVLKEKKIDFNKEQGAKESPRSLKAAFYLTKIARTLLPEHIPDIYQSGESVNGMQTIDRERIAHTPGHTALQEARQSGKSEKAAAKQLGKELGAGIEGVDSKLEAIGFGLAIDENMGNYTKDEEGNIRYLETFTPWEILPGRRRVPTLAFDVAELSEAITAIPDAAEREKCSLYLTRVLTLFEEEKEAVEQAERERLVDSGPAVHDIETQIASFKETYSLERLSALETREEALASEERTAARHALGPILEKIKATLQETDITDEKYLQLHDELRILSRAVGTLNSGKVDHTR